MYHFCCCQDLLETLMHVYFTFLRTMGSNEEYPSPSGNLPLQFSVKRISKARKSGSGDHQKCSPLRKNHVDDPNGIIVAPPIDSRELDRLKFTNPGRQMEELEVGWSEANMTRSVRRQMSVKSSYKSSDRLHPLYDSRGRLLGTLDYSCDCLKSECPGCHLPCRRCHSTFCGASCRIYRTYRVNEVKLFI
ncbi:unnamed protein product [Schistosoma rodhaini]|uniref:ARF7 effector protein C-terminal domain-containing protein n=1 Tax=Schistosoma rodhaini TaxID=6188 RepID=A0AA85FW32_9TREM|nr:unnamed protein product [Schistosoma rodhaini]